MHPFAQSVRGPVPPAATAGTAPGLNLPSQSFLNSYERTRRFCVPLLPYGLQKSVTGSRRNQDFVNVCLKQDHQTACKYFIHQNCGCLFFLFFFSVKLILMAINFSITVNLSTMFQVSEIRFTPLCPVSIPGLPVLCAECQRR